MPTQRLTIGFIACAIVALAISALATAATDDNQGPMRISDVRFTDLNDATQIEIAGTQFDNGAAPSVTLDGNPIQVNGASATLIQAELPGNTADGDYTIGVSTGSGNKQSAEHGLTVAPLVAMTAPCLDWFVTGGVNQHIHNEIHVEDEYGDPVLGATVTFISALDGVVYQNNVSATTKTAGHNRGAGCSDPAGEGVTGWFCCIGAGPFSPQGPPGKNTCPAGEYSAEILSIEPPPGTTLVWDGVQPSGTAVYFDPDN
jgi:hypothetical protein